MDFEIPADLADYLDRARRLHRAGDQAARAAGRQHPLLRPPPRGRPHRLGARRAAERRVGGAAARGPAPGRRRRPLPLPVPEGVRRPGRHQPRHGGHPRAPRPQGPRPALRPPERALDRRQQRRPAADDRLRHRRAEGGVDRRPRRGPAAASRSASPSRSTAPTRPTWRRPPCATATSGSSTARRRGTPASTPRQYDLIFARTSGKAGDGHGITAFLVPTSSPGFEIVEFLWTFNMPTDHAHIRLTDVRVPAQRRSSAARARASRSCSTSSTRTASARPRRASAPRSSASTESSSTPRCARRSASRSRRTRRSSSRSSSCTRSARCCGR